MEQSKFLELIQARHEQCIATLERKGKIYAYEGDRLSNFKDVGAMNQVSPQEALWGMVSKHIIATKDMVKSGEIPSEKWIAEYLGDRHNYLYLLEAIWREAREDAYKRLE